MAGVDVNNLVNTLDSLNALSFEDDFGRKKVLEAAQALHRRLESPIETIIRIGWNEPPLYATLRVFYEVGMFQLLAEDGGSPKSNVELAEKSGMDPTLSARMFKHLAANGYVHEIGPDRYKPTPFCLGLNDATIGGGITYLFDTCIPVVEKLPDYFSKTSYRNPTDPTKGPWQHATGSKDHFSWLNDHPKISEAFMSHMAGYSRGKPAWTDFYPVEEVLGKGYKPETALLVDVGGGIGNDMETFRRGFPGLQGKIVVQDQQQVIQSITTDPNETGVEGMVHDFFQAQPILGARAYFLHSVLHDWSDKDAVRILEALRPALTPGYSKVLINENAIANTGADPVATSLDLCMMMLNASSERTEQQWRDLLEKAGFKVNGVWIPAGGTGQGLIEAEVA